MEILNAIIVCLICPGLADYYYDCLINDKCFVMRVLDAGMVIALIFNFILGLAYIAQHLPF